MVQASRGTRKKTRKLLSRKPRERGLSPITREFQSFDVGQKVNVIIDPSIHKGMPFHRFHGLTGTVTGQQGDSYVVEVRSGNKLKTVVSRPEHLKKVA
jgi:large subunit ribosomal protein L21e